MKSVLFVAGRLVYLLLNGVWLLMIARVIMELLPVEEENPLYRFSIAVTEPVVIPFRVLAARFTDAETSPVDVGFFAAFFVLGLLLRMVVL